MLERKNGRIFLRPLTLYLQKGQKCLGLPLGPVCIQARKSKERRRVQKVGKTKRKKSKIPKNDATFMP